MGLCKAAQAFNNNAGFKFSTLALDCIYNEIKVNIRSTQSISRSKYTTISNNQFLDEHNMDLFEGIADENNIYDNLDAKELINQIDKCKNYYGSVSAKIVDLHLFENKSFTEISKILNISKQAVSRRYSNFLNIFMRYFKY